jgi:hypothetical protein
MFEALTRAFLAFWDNQDPERSGGVTLPEDGRYRFEVTDISVRENTLFVTFVYCAEEQYCCESIGCLCCRLYVARDWAGLRRWLGRAGVELGSPMKVVARVEVEEGALFAVEPAEPARGYLPQREHRWDVYVLDEAKPGQPAECIASSA